MRNRNVFDLVSSLWRYLRSLHLTMELCPDKGSDFSPMDGVLRKFHRINLRLDSVIAQNALDRQLTSAHFKGLPKERGITRCKPCGRSLGQLGDAEFFSSLNTERRARKVFRTRAEAHLGVFDYNECSYKSTRRHSMLEHVSPIQYEEAL
jgi:hypothetical protein